MDLIQLEPAYVLRAVGNESRLRILHLLRGRELCVCELVDALGRPHYAVSRDLAALQNAGFIHERRQGSWVYHSIAPEARADAFRVGLLKLVARRLAATPEARADEARLARRLALRDGGRTVVNDVAGPGRHLCIIAKLVGEIAVVAPDDQVPGAVGVGRLHFGLADGPLAAVPANGIETGPRAG